MTTRLEDLPNLGKTTQQWLRAIGIRDRETLERRGIFWAYTSMRARRFRVTTAVLYALAGALENRPWRTLSSAEKERLLQRLASYERRQDGLSQPATAARHPAHPAMAARASDTANPVTASQPATASLPQPGVSTSHGVTTHAHGPPARARGSQRRSPQGAAAPTQG